MKKVRIMQYSISKSARALKGALKEAGVDNIMTLKVSGSSYRGFPSHIIINWGCSDRRTIRDGIEILNEPEAVDKAQDKIKTFQNLELTPTPKWTTDREIAQTWVDSGHNVYCRTLTRSREGNGIVLSNSENPLVFAPLYTRGVEIKREVRIHIFKGGVIDFTQKKKMSSERREQEGIGEVDLLVRNHHRGWVFARADVALPEDAKSAAISAVEELGLDFGAVDVVITPQDAAKVLEVNTAPGLQGTTLENYKNAFFEYISTSV
jgi:hypothetical protein